MLYDLNWNAHPEYCIFTSHYRRSEILPQPQNLGKMIEVAEKLSKGFPVVRVDLYNIAGRVFFGEMTFTSLGGMMDFYAIYIRNMRYQLGGVSFYVLIELGLI